MLTDMQLQWIRGLHSVLRSLWLDRIFLAWDYVDSAYFSTLVIVLVWYLWDRRIGIRFFYIMSISLLVNTLLKYSFDQPRPCQIDPAVGLICYPSSGFPSGAAQSATIYFGLVFFECKRALYRWLALVFAFLLCFSRVYLGIHYPSDILGGIVVGCLLLLMYKKLFPVFEKRWKIAAVSFSFLFLLLGLLLSQTSYIYLFFLTLGVAAGLITYEKLNFQIVKSLPNRILQTLYVIVGLAVLFTAEIFFPALEILWSFGRGVWLSLGGAWIQKRFRRH